MKHSSIAVLLCAAASLAGCGSDDESAPVDEPDEGEFVRPVVLAERPLALENTWVDSVTWPIWGSAMSLAESVEVEADLEAADGSSTGIAFAGPGEMEERLAVELVRGEGVWILRETNAGEVVQEKEVAGGASDDFVIELAASGTSVKVTNGASEATLEPSTPLAPDGQAAGIYVQISGGTSLGIGKLATTQPLPKADDLGSPLRKLAEARGIRIGTATDIWPPLHDLGFEALLTEQFGVTAPTEFYMPTTRGEDEDYFFVPADLMVNYATVHGQTVSGYFLVWDFELPEWVNEIAYSGDSAALGALYDDHITTTVSRYQGRVNEWVVVNEAIWGPEVTEEESAMFAETIWSDVLGSEYIERAFTVARAADPEAKLLYNETGAETLGAKSDFMYEMAADFVARGVPIDGIGLQFHIDAASPPDMEGVKANMERFGELGLEVYITELDVNLVSLTGTTEENLEAQAQLYAAVLETCLSVPACKTYTIFGVSDRYAWDEQEGGSAAPLLFDEEYRAKPAYYAVQSVLQGS